MIECGEIRCRLFLLTGLYVRSRHVWWWDLAVGRRGGFINVGHQGLGERRLPDRCVGCLRFWWWHRRSWLVGGVSLLGVGHRWAERECFFGSVPVLAPHGQPFHQCHGVRLAILGDTVSGSDRHCGIKCGQVHRWCVIHPRLGTAN